MLCTKPRSTAAKPIDTDGNIQCAACERWKPLTEFHKSAKGHHGVASWCKLCASNYRKKYYLEHREKYLARSRKRYVESKEYVNQWRSRNYEHRIQWEGEYWSVFNNFLRRMISNAKTRAKKKDREFAINSDWVREQLDWQHGRCYYTGLALTYDASKGGRWSNVSIDRIDSCKGYTASNCVLCCAAFNRLKHNLTLDLLGILATAFVKHQDAQQLRLTI